MFHFELIKAWLIVSAFWGAIILAWGILRGYPLWFIGYDALMSMAIALTGAFSGFTLAMFTSAFRRGVMEGIVRRGATDRHALINLGYSPVKPQKPKREDPCVSIVRHLSALIPPGHPATTRPIGHANVDLRTHCESVSKSLVALWKKACAEGLTAIPSPRYFKWPENADVRRYSESYVAMIGYAHDVGKTISYVKESGKWIDRDQNHAANSARLFKLCPHVKHLSFDESNEAAFILEYYHSGYSLPRARWISPDAFALLGLLIIADQETSKAEGLDIEAEYIDERPDDLSFASADELTAEDIVGQDQEAIEVLNEDRAYEMITATISDIVKRKIPAEGSVVAPDQYMVIIRYDHFLTHVKERLSHLGIPVDGQCPMILINYFAKKDLRSVKVRYDELSLCRFAWEGSPGGSVGIPLNYDDLALLGIDIEDIALPASQRVRYWSYQFTAPYTMREQYVPISEEHALDDTDDDEIREPPPKIKADDLEDYPPSESEIEDENSDDWSSDDDDEREEAIEDDDDAEDDDDEGDSEKPSHRYASSHGDHLAVEHVFDVAEPDDMGDSMVDDGRGDERAVDEDRIDRETLRKRIADIVHSAEQEDAASRNISDDHPPSSQIPRRGRRPEPVGPSGDSPGRSPPFPPERVARPSAQTTSPKLAQSWRQLVILIKGDSTIEKRVDSLRRPVASIPSDHPLFPMVIDAIERRIVPARAILHRSAKEIQIVMF